MRAKSKFVSTRKNIQLIN